APSHGASSSRGRRRRPLLSFQVADYPTGINGPAAMGGALKLSARCATPAFVFTANPTLPAAKAASGTESLLTSSRLRESVLPLVWQESVDIAFWADSAPRRTSGSWPPLVSNVLLLASTLTPMPSRSKRPAPESAIDVTVTGRLSASRRTLMGPWLPVWAPIDQELGKKILSGRRF